MYLKGRIMRCMMYGTEHLWKKGSLICSEFALIKIVQLITWIKNNCRLSFRRWINEELQDQLRNLCNMLFRYKSYDGKDVAIWKREKSGKFSVASVYINTYIWKQERWLSQAVMESQKSFKDRNLCVVNISKCNSDKR